MSPPKVTLAIEMGSSTCHYPVVETREGPGGSLILAVQVEHFFDLGTYRVTIVQGDRRTRGGFSAFGVRAEAEPLRCIGNFWPDAGPARNDKLVPQLQLWMHSATGGRFVVMVNAAGVQLAVGPVADGALRAFLHDKLLIPWEHNLASLVQQYISEFEQVWPPVGRLAGDVAGA